MVVLGKNLVQGFLDQKETQNDGSIFFLNISMKLQQHKDCKFGEAIQTEFLPWPFQGKKAPKWTYDEVF